MTLTEKAMRIATRAHAGQTRKESDLPYITHPFMVALLLQKYDFSEAVSYHFRRDWAADKAS